ncbi:MAG: 30S ribosomal protein S21 [Candidatus Babeliaceae bacterium]
MRRANVAVAVPDSHSVEKALRKLKKLAEREGLNRDMKRRIYFESPSQKRRKRTMRAIKQNWIRMAAHKLI